MSNSRSTLTFDAQPVIDTEIEIFEDKKIRETTKVEDRLVGAELGFRDGRGNRENVVSIHVDHPLPDVVNPYWYHYLDPTDPRADPCIQIIAGPGVSIKFQRDSSLSVPVSIIRIQDARCLPSPEEVLNRSDFLAPFTTPLMDGEIDTSDDSWLARAGRDVARLLDTRRLATPAGRLTTLIHQPLPNGKLFTALGARQSILVQVPASANGPPVYKAPNAKVGPMLVGDGPPKHDEKARFAWEWSPSSSMLTIVKTGDVDVFLLDEHFSGVLSSFNTGAPPPRWYRIIEVGDIEKVPASGALGKTTGTEVEPVRQGPMAERVLDMAGIGLELALSLHPVSGYAISVYESVYGESILGKRLSRMERTIAGIAVALPIVSKGATGIAEAASKFGAWGHEAQVLGQSLQGGGFPIEAVRDAGKAIESGQSSARYHRQILGGLQNVPPMSGTLLTDSGKAFRNPILQELWIAEQRVGRQTLEASQFVKNAPAAPRRLMAKLAGGKPPIAPKVAPTPRVNATLFGVSVHLDQLAAKNFIARIRAAAEKFRNLGKWYEDISEAAAKGKHAVVALMIRRLPQWVVDHLKGTFAEILAYRAQLARMAELAQLPQYRGRQLRLYRNIQVRLGDSTVVPFTDGVIGYLDRAGKLVVVDISEVKSGLNGFLEAAAQVKKWKGKLSGTLVFTEEASAVRLVPGNAPKTLVPAPVTLLAEQSFELADEVERSLYIVRGASTRPLSSRYDDIAKGIRVVGLAVTEPDLRYLILKVLELELLEKAKRASTLTRALSN